MLGIGWAVFRPLITSLIYTLVFAVFVKVKTEIPYPIFAFAALIPWLYFSNTLSSVTSSVAGASNLLSKVYFPRLILPLAAIGPGLIEVGIQLVIIGLMMIFFQYPPGFPILALPLFIGITSLTALAFGIWLTALNVKYRDVGMSVPFFVQVWMYLCPIVYPMSMVPDKWRTLYSLNPMVGVIEGFRWSLLGTSSPDWAAMAASAFVMCVLLVTGLYFFRRTEATFADVV